MKRSLCILGVTGSIGDSTCDVVRQNPELFSIHSVAAHSNWQKVAALVKEFNIPMVAMWDEQSAELLSKALNKPVLQGMDGILQLVQDPQSDTVLNALVGAVGCLPTLKTIEVGKILALANKESMVMAGPLIEELLQKNPLAKIYPVDSEHNAIFQCLASRPISEVESLQLTASGGPFRTLPASEFSKITLERALNHPTWSMGPKITIDSSTLMNKGLEVIEAHYLFQVPYEQIQVVVHPQSIVHSLVQFRDGSLMAQLGVPDMKVPIQNALTVPHRLPLQTGRVNLAEIGTLSFEKPDMQKFPCLRLAYEAGKKAGTATAILNAANEVLVAAFLDQKISYLSIPKYLEAILGESTIENHPNLDEILKADQLARLAANKYIQS
jgi:1-deoxy-D-xylulose-5-phosphate reductoisomerase